MNSKAVVFGCAGLRLTGAERRFFALDRSARAGSSLLRNVEAPDQLCALTATEFQARASAGPMPWSWWTRKAAGSSVLGPPHWRAAPPAARFGELASRNQAKASEAAGLNARLLAGELAAVGIDTVCAPVLDLRFPGAHDVIGDRAFAGDPAIVAVLGRAAAEGFLAAGVTPIMKHIPGHGRSQVDSHLSLPVVEASRAELEASDFRPFKALADLPWAMTAHLLYRAIDGEHPATMSARVVGEIIRGHIGFRRRADRRRSLHAGAFGTRSPDRAAATSGRGLRSARLLHCNGKDGGDGGRGRRDPRYRRRDGPQARAGEGRGGRGAEIERRGCRRDDDAARSPADGRPCLTSNIGETIRTFSVWVLPVLFSPFPCIEAAHGFGGLETGRRHGPSAGQDQPEPAAAYRSFRNHPSAGGAAPGPQPVSVRLCSSPCRSLGFLGRLRNPRRDTVLVAAAGPVMNIALALISAALMHVAVLLPDAAAGWGLLTLDNSIQLNLGYWPSST